MCTNNFGERSKRAAALLHEDIFFNSDEFCFTVKVLDSGNREYKLYYYKDNILYLLDSAINDGHSLWNNRDNIAKKINLKDCKQVEIED